ncbi:MAG: tetraacyldisaccharide 4'-kinase [Gammaproteobacteria bacterium]
MKTPAYFWKKWHPVALLLSPLSLLMWVVVAIRRLLYDLRIFRVHRCSVPVIVVGNLTVGGTGKTPLVIWICNHLKKLGYNPGVVLRGYGGTAASWPQQVRRDSDPHVVGDEAVVIAAETGCPVCAGPDRVDAAKALVQHARCDVILSDDGLQHYALGRDIEIVVIDGERRFGNGLLLPAGPLREGVGRLRRADFIIINGNCSDNEHCMQQMPGEVINLETGETMALEEWSGRMVHLVSGIGNPARFIDMVRGAGIETDQRLFPDHHDYGPGDLEFNDDLPVLMTAKDAVKVRPFADNRFWYLKLRVDPSATFVHQVVTALIMKRDHGQKTA